MSRFRYGSLALCIAMAAYPAAVFSAVNDHIENGGERVSPHRTNPEENSVPSGTTGSQSPAITFHGGPVMSTPNVYLIWYGNWNQTNGSDTATGQTLVSKFLAGLNGSPYFQINTTYNGPTGGFSVSGTYSDAYSQGSRLTDARVQNVVKSAISNGKLPLDTHGIYFVLTSSDVAETSGFCSKYCGWHTAATIQNTDIKYAFVGNANRCLNACAAQTISPNNNAGVDGMISVIAHELEEATTDPDLNAWYDANGAENADKCAWTFGQPASSGGPLQQLSSGAYYNMTLGTLNFLVQRNLQASDNTCRIALNGQQ